MAVTMATRHRGTVPVVVWNGAIYFGLWYPITFALMTFVVGMLFVKETKHVNIHTYNRCLFASKNHLNKGLL